MTEIVSAPRWVGPWLVILVVWLAVAAPILVSDVGQLALVDEAVRRVEAFGGTVSDAEYDGWLQHPPLTVYATSGGRLLLTPPVTLAVALGLMAAARAYGRTASLAEGLAVSVHASVPLLVGQVLATPIDYVRESLTNPFSLAALVPLVEPGTWPAQVMGVMDLFGVWWIALVAVGLSALTGRKVGGLLVRLVGVYIGIAAIMAGILMASGGV